MNNEHPVMKGLTPIESWDESYVHSKHNTNRVVLAERRDEKGNEPYTWVRQVGKGARLLHRVGPRPADLGQSAVHRARRKRYPLGRRGGDAELRREAVMNLVKSQPNPLNSALNDHR